MIFHSAVFGKGKRNVSFIPVSSVPKDFVELFNKDANYIKVWVDVTLTISSSSSSLSSMASSSSTSSSTSSSSSAKAAVKRLTKFGVFLNYSEHVFKGKANCFNIFTILALDSLSFQ